MRSLGVIILAASMSVSLAPVGVSQDAEVPKAPDTQDAEEPKAPDATKIFEEQQCSLCHSVSSEEIVARVTTPPVFGGDLTGVGSRHDAEWLTSYLRRQLKVDGKRHSRQLKLNDAEMQAVVTWLRELKPAEDTEAK